MTTDATPSTPTATPASSSDSSDSSAGSESGALPRVLSDDQVEQFRQDGYTLIEGVLSPEEAAHYRRVILDLLPDDLTLDETWGSYHGRLKPHGPDHDQTIDTPELIPLMGNEKLYLAMAQLHGTRKLRAFDGSVGITMRDSAHGDEVLSQILHLDASVPRDTDFLFTPAELQIGGCHYLTDVEPNGGGIHVVPGGHLKVMDEVGKANAAGENGRALHGNWRRIEHLKSVEVTGPAGSFALLHHLMPHGASHNRRPTARVAHFMRYVPVPHAHGADRPMPRERYDAARLAAMTPLTRRLLGVDDWD